MQTYIFTVAVTGPDVQEFVEGVRNLIIEDADEPDGVDVMVTESVRVTG